MDQFLEHKKRSTRIEWVDISKGIGTIFVMYGHCYLDSRYNFWIYSFHMALFFFLSGYTFNADRTNYASFVYKKIRTILIPYVFIAAVTIIYEKSQAMLHIRDYSITSVIIKYLLQQRYTVLWFLTCLYLGEQIIYVFYTHVSVYKHLIWLIISAVFCLLFFMIRRFIGINMIWNADLAVLAGSFISLGVVTRHFGLLNSLLENKWTTLVSLLLSIICSYCNYKYFAVVDWYTNSFGNIGLFVVASISGIVTTISFSINTGIKYPIRTGLLYLGKYS